LLDLLKRPFVEAHIGWLSHLCFNREHIKPVRNGVDSPNSQELRGYSLEITPLFQIDCFFGRRQAGPATLLRRDGTRFYFDESQHRAIVADHVDLAFKSGKREIARYQRVALSSEIPVGVGLSSDAGQQRPFFQVMDCLF
jgi:hypothetical protein